MPLCLWRPNIATALEYARDRALPVQLTFDGRPREAGPLLCTVTFTARDITVLSTAEPLIPAELKGGECRIYFKPDIEANPEEARDGQEESGKAAVARHGFYCNCRVQDVRRDAGNALTEITLKTPFRSLWRELRRHERLRLGPDMLKKFRFWFAPMLPEQRGQVQIYMSRYRQALERKIRLIDVSAGGAFVRLVDYDLLNDIDIDQNTLCLLYLDCNGPEGESRKFFLAAHSVIVGRNKKDSALNLHLRFVRYLSAARRDAVLDWQPVGEEGVPGLDLWITARLGGPSGSGAESQAAPAR